MSEFALTLKLTRIRQGLTQVELANRTGLSHVTISHLENGKHRPHRGTKQSIQQVLGAVDWQETFSNGLINSN